MAGPVHATELRDGPNGPRSVPGAIGTPHPDYAEIAEDMRLAGAIGWPGVLDRTRLPGVRRRQQPRLSPTDHSSHLCLSRHTVMGL